jgi:hypothetical protein
MIDNDGNNYNSEPLQVIWLLKLVHIVAMSLDTTVAFETITAFKILIFRCMSLASS